MNATTITDKVLLHLDRTRYSDLLPRIRTAEARWRHHNHQRRTKGCGCGAPATVLSNTYEVTGRVPFEVWTCVEHEGVETWHNGQALWEHAQPCPICPGGGPVRLGTHGITDRWCCPHKELP